MKIMLMTPLPPVAKFGQIGKSMKCARRISLGCLLCEVYQTGSGQPALLYVVPAMIGTLIATNFDLFLDVKKRADLFECDGSDGNNE